MRSYIAAFVIATVVAAVLTPIVRRLALRYDIVSRAGARDVHAGVIPRMGGIAICLALFVPVIGILFVEAGAARAFEDELSRVIALAVGGVAMCFLGAVDDVRGVRAIYKLAFQVAVASAAFFAGFRIDFVMAPFIGVLPMGIFALPVTVLWVVLIVNAVNLIDGLDGLAAGVVFFAGLTNFVVAYISGSIMSALIMAALLGAVLGFLFYNFNPARIFMGDSGSYLLGFVLAQTALIGTSQKASTAVSLLVPVVALGVPIFDTLFTMGRRYLERRPIFSPDRGHVHHRLLDLGITHRRAVLVLYGVSCIFTVLSIGIYLGRSWQIGVAMLAASVVVIGLARFVGYFSLLHLRKRQRARVRSRETERLRRLAPEFSSRLEAPRHTDALFEDVFALAREGGVRSVSFFSEGREVAAWSADDGHDRRVVAVMEYPLGPDALARATMRVTVVNDFEDAEMAPQTDILLQVLADVIATNLTRLGSDYAPRTVAPKAAAVEPGEDEVVPLAVKVR